MQLPLRNFSMHALDGTMEGGMSDKEANRGNEHGSKGAGNDLHVTCMLRGRFRVRGKITEGVQQRVLPVTL